MDMGPAALSNYEAGPPLQVAPTIAYLAPVSANPNSGQVEKDKVRAKLSNETDKGYFKVLEAKEVSDDHQSTTNFADGYYKAETGWFPKNKFLQMKSKSKREHFFHVMIVYYYQQELKLCPDFMYF